GTVAGYVPELRDARQGAHVVCRHGPRARDVLLRRHRPEQRRSREPVLFGGERHDSVTRRSVRAMPERFELVGRRHVLAPELLALAEHELLPVHDVGAARGRVADDLDSIAGLDLVAGPAVAQEDGPRAAFREPLLVLAVRAFD